MYHCLACTFTHPVVVLLNNPQPSGKVFSWLTGRNQKPTTGNGVMTVARHGNSDGGGATVSIRMFGSHGNSMNRIVIEEPDADLNF